MAQLLLPTEPMARPLRMLEPERLYLVTNRTVQRRMLMRPSPHVNLLIGGILAYALVVYPNVDLYAFVFTSNHFHMVLRADEGVLSRFMAFVQSQIALKVGRHHGWCGPFFERRYDAAPILDDDALHGVLQYVLAHGTKENLVEDPERWPGLTCIPELVHGQNRVFPWYDWTARNQAARRGDKRPPSCFVRFHTLRMTPLPAWAALPAAQRQRHGRELLDIARRRATEARAGRPALGVEAVLRQDPHGVPARISRKPRTLCHATSSEARRGYRERYRAFVREYREASRRWRAGETAEFPRYAYHPPPPYGWALSPPARADAA